MERAKAYRTWHHTYADSWLHGASVHGATGACIGVYGTESAPHRTCTTNKVSTVFHIDGTRTAAPVHGWVERMCTEYACRVVMETINLACECLIWWIRAWTAFGAGRNWRERAPACLRTGSKRSFEGFDGCQKWRLTCIQPNKRDVGGMAVCDQGLEEKCSDGVGAFIMANMYVKGRTCGLR